MCLAQNAKSLRRVTVNLGDLVSRSLPFQLPDGTADFLDDVISEVLEYIQGHKHLSIVEGSRCSLAEKKDSLEQFNGGLVDPSLKGSSFHFHLRVIFIFVFVLVLDHLFARVNAPVMPSLLTSFEGFKLSRRHQPFISSPPPGGAGGLAIAGGQVQ